MSGPRPNSSRSSSLAPRSLSPRALITLLVAILLITTFVAIAFTDITGSSGEDEDNGETPEVLARTGCLDMDIIPAYQDPPVSLFVAESDVREQLDVAGTVSGIGDDDEFEPGDLVWAEYGELAPGTSGRVHSGEAWVLVFEDERHESWWDRLANRRIDARFSVVYRPESGQIIAACGGEV